MYCYAFFTTFEFGRLGMFSTIYIHEHQCFSKEDIFHSIAFGRFLVQDRQNRLNEKKKLPFVDEEVSQENIKKWCGAS